MPSQPFEKMKKRYQITVGVGGVFLASIFVYGIAILILKNSGFSALATGRMIDIARLIFLAVSITQLLVTPFLDYHHHGPGYGAVPVYQDTEIWPVVLAQLFKSSILILVLCEIPAFLGFVLYLLGGRAQDFALLAVISVISFTFYFPRYRHWEYEFRKMN